MYAHGDLTAFHSTLERDFNASFYPFYYKAFSPDMKALINDKIRYRHPYQTEIEEYKFPPSMYTKRDPIMYQSYEDTTATLVDTEEAVEEMLEELKKAKEIAIDLEHHDQRTYLGVVCLMQISTRERDWVIDTLKPWRRRLECLNEVFTDPSIIKVDIVSRNMLQDPTK
jgi:exosome complex exonuclease RRP6